MPNEVRADVSKAGQLFVSDIWLHRAEDSFDLSFEAGFPEVRWLTDNIVEFYRPEYFDQGADSLTVENNAGKLIKYLRVQSGNKFLIFELGSGKSISLKIPAARGDPLKDVMTLLVGPVTYSDCLDRSGWSDLDKDFS